MTAVSLSLLSGGVTALCIASVWSALQLPSRVMDMLELESARLCALALCLGCMLASSGPVFGLPQAAAAAFFLFAGAFVGMLASALTEVLEVVPMLFDRLSITADMRVAAVAMALGKMAGAYIGCALGY